MPTLRAGIWQPCKIPPENRKDAKDATVCVWGLAALRIFHEKRQYSTIQDDPIHLAFHRIRRLFIFLTGVLGRNFLSLRDICTHGSGRAS
jgi:hypothetical protein